MGIAKISNKVTNVTLMSYFNLLGHNVFR